MQAEAAGAGREALKKLHATMFLQRRARGWLVQADGRSAVVQAAALLDVRATRASCGHHTAALGRLSSFVRIQRLTREGLDATRAWRAPAGSALRRMLAAVGGRSALSCCAEVAVVMGVCVCSNYVAAGRIVRLCLIIRPIHGTSLYNIANSGTTPRRFQGLRFLRPGASRHPHGPISQWTVTRHSRQSTV